MRKIIKMRKMRKMRKKGMANIVLIVVGVILLFGFTGLVKFAFFQDKTPYIIGGIIILLMILKDRRRG